MSFEFRNQVALVTGAASGIGLAPPTPLPTATEETG